MKSLIASSNVLVVAVQVVLFFTFQGGGVLSFVVKRQQQPVILQKKGSMKRRIEYDNVACSLSSSFPSSLSYYQRYCVNHRSLVRMQMSEEFFDTFKDKKIYERTFYKISSDGGAFLSKPNAFVLEERLRYLPPDEDGSIESIGPRTYIFREGVTYGEKENKIGTTKELYRIDIAIPSQKDDDSKHSGVIGVMDDAIATVLYLASNPELIQGNTMQLEASDGRSDGFEAMMGFIGATLTSTDDDDFDSKSYVDVKNTTGWLFPPKVQRLMLSGNGGDGSSGGGFIGETSNSSPPMKKVLKFVKQFPVSNEKVALKDLRWRGTSNIRNAPNPFRGRSDQNRDYYRTIIGSNIELSFPEAKDLAKTIAYHMLPSNEYAISTLTTSSTESSSSFGAIGMDLAGKTVQSEEEVKINPRIPPTYIHVHSESGYGTSENIVHLKKFLEKGYRMTVNHGGYDNRLVIESTSYDYQVLPKEAPESDLDNDIEQTEVVDRKTKSYQVLSAIHHPQYAPGSEEIFFPLESGEFYDGDDSFSPQLDTGSRY